MEFRNVIFAIALSFAVLFGWSVIFETPRIEEQKKLQQSETNLKSENNESLVFLDQFGISFSLFESRVWDFNQ